MKHKIGKQDAPKFVPSTVMHEDGSITISIANLNGPHPSNVYAYSTTTGKAEVIDKLKTAEWVGQINIVLSLEHRVWGTAKNLIGSRFGLPTTSQELERLIKTRTGDKKLWWTLGDEKKKIIHPVSLPNLLALMKKMEAPPNDTTMAVIGNVTVAPRWQRQGFGLALHEMAAALLKQLGYKKMVSDLVGLNTTGEQAVWKKLRKNYPVVSSRKPPYSPLNMLIKAHVNRPEVGRPTESYKRILCKRHCDVI